MGVVYHGNYPAYYEVARVESLRAMGFSYKRLEDSGVMLPVLQFHIDFKKPARYDDLLTVTSKIKEVPQVKLRFDTEIHNAAGELLNTGHVVLAFVNKQTFRPQRAPKEMQELLTPLIVS